jgi:sn-glycerol 3-phosphate transport system ATP-binding protein
MRVELIELHKRLGTTFIYVTHDQIEAMSMGDNIVLMDKGIIMQRSSPKEIYHNPQNVYTAQFIGTPPMNILSTLIPDIQIGFRPEKTALMPLENPGLQIKGKILTKEQLGAEMNYSVNTFYGKIMVKSEDEVEGSRCVLNIKKEHLFAFDLQGRRIEMTADILSRLAALPQVG